MAGRFTRSGSRRSACWAVAVLVCCCARFAAAADVADEYEVKAALIFNLARFVEWPAARMSDGRAPFVIGVLGAGQLTPQLQQAARNKTVGEHPVIVRTIKRPEAAGGCHVLFISRSERKQFAGAAAMLAGFGVLTVGESDNFAAEGGVIGLVVRESRVQMEVNLKAARQSGVIISSRLLRLATVVGKAD